MWVDKKLYWSWEGKKAKKAESPPTNKCLEYVELKYPKRPQRNFSICCGVWDNDKYTPLHREEIARKFRAVHIWPDGRATTVSIEERDKAWKLARSYKKYLDSVV